MSSDDALIKGLKSRINELCDAREVDKAIEAYAKAKNLCSPNNPLYNGILESHSHLLATIKAYVHFVLDQNCRVRPYRSKIIFYMEYAGMTSADLTSTESKVLQSL